MMAVLNKMKELMDAGVFGRDAISYEVENNVTSFGEGKIAMLLRQAITLTVLTDGICRSDRLCQFPVF